MSVHPLQSICSEYGVFLRREAVALGVTDRALQRWCRNGKIVRVRHGAYTFATLWEPLDDGGRHVVRTRAVLRTHSETVMASHHTATVLHGMDRWNVELGRVHLTRLDALSGRVMSDVVHHEGLWLPGDVTVRERIPVSVPARAALESASLGSVEQGLVTVDSGLRLGLFTVEQLTEHYTRMHSWPSSQHLQLVTRLADGRSGSAGETRSRYLFWAAGLPAPELQYPVYEGGALIGIADFAWPELGVLGEFDGRVKYSRYLHPGEEPGDAVFREKQREDRMRLATGWRFFRITWDMLSNPVRTSAALRAVLNAAA